MAVYRAPQIADYLLSLVDPEVGDAITNLKLQKLCYYAQGLSMATRGEPMFSETVEAWKHGPVVPALYHRYKEQVAGALPVDPNFDPAAIAPADKSLLDDVFSFYGQYSAWKLREMTHEEAPWRDAWARGSSAPISNEALHAHFGPQVSDDYRRAFNAKVR